MLLVDEDLELLEAFLDGALGTEETAALRSRLSVEAELGAALDSVRVHRAMRQQWWASLEPSDAKVEAFVAQINRATTRRSWLIRPLRIAAAVAACGMIGFFAGWQFRGRQAAPVNVPGLARNLEAVNHYQVALTDENDQVTAVQEFSSLEKAREFTQDLTLWQERQRQVRNGAAVILADRF